MTYTSLPDGFYTFQVTPTDEAGQSGFSVNYSWRIDTAPPIVEFLLTPSPITSSTEETFGFWCSNKPSCEFRCALDHLDNEGVFTTGSFASCTSPQFLTDLDAGNYTYRIEATAPNGLSTVVTYSWEVISPAWTAISSGNDFTCALTAAGGLWCWGFNGTGRLGLGDTTLRRTPHLVGIDGTWASVATGSAHACAIQKDKSLWCWGEGFWGRLGTGSTTTQTSPTRVGSDNDWVQVATGQTHTCAIKTDGTLWCWGHGAQGRLGLDDGNLNHNTPQLVPDHQNWATLALSNSATCAIKTNGALYCWGYGIYGQIANGSTTASSTSPLLVGDEFDNWTHITMGTTYGCAIKDSPIEGRALYCWGRNNDGQLGLGHTNDRTLPNRVGTDGDWADVLAGGTTTCARKQDQRLFCWGNGIHGNLGNLASMNPTDTPIPIGTRTDWNLLSVGNRHTCAIDQEEDLFCWGYDFHGQLGLDINSSAKSTPTEVSTDQDPILLAAGRNNACFIAADQTLWCWGNNTSGKLGLGDTHLRPYPFQIGDDQDWILVNNSMSGGTFGDFTHTCAIKTNGSLWCWGQGSRGRLGHGNNTSYSAPRQVTHQGWEDWTAVSTGGEHTCGLRNGGELYCWGRNFYGQLGLGDDIDTDTSDRSLPERVGDDLWSHVQAGYRHTCAIQAQDNSLWCWGYSLQGQIGTGSNEHENSIPQQVIPPPPEDPEDPEEVWTWTHLSLLYDHTCATQENNTLWCWGYNVSGVLGVGDNTSRTRPTQVGTDQDWVHISAGGTHTCAIKEDTTLWCWGRAENGQIGPDFTNSFTNPNPIQIAGTGWLDVIAGGFTTYALQDVGANTPFFFSWGENKFGELGDATALQRTPVLLERR